MAGLALALAVWFGGADAAGDPERGEKLYARCATCHKLDPAASMKLGPPLHAIFESPAGRIVGYEYSEALRKAAADGLIWTTENLDAYLTKPGRFIPKTKMQFAGLPRQRDRMDIIAFLQAVDGRKSAAADISVSPEILAIQGDREYGEYLAGECTTCHRSSGEQDGIPNIDGLPTEAFVIAMHGYREKRRDHPAMQMIAGRLTDEDIAALAAYFSESDR